MNEVEKMYENAGIKPNYIDACTVEDKYWQNEELANEYGTFDMYMNAKCGQQEDCTTLCFCAYTKKEYPPFTAEKQLSLMAFLINTGIRVNLNKEKDTNIIVDAIARGLAGATNQIWQDLTEEERKQIKEILE